MKKKASFTRNSKRTLRIDSHLQPSDQLKKQKIELPKLNHSEFNQKIAKKTLMMGIKKVEEYIELCHDDVSSKVTESLNTLKGQALSGVKHIYTNFRLTTEVDQNASALKENHLAQSQIVNVNRGQLRKVASKDLFDKVTKCKYSVGQVLNVTDKEVITALKAKIEEKDSTIRKLHVHVQELKTQTNELKNALAFTSIEKKHLEEQKEEIHQKNGKISRKNEQVCLNLTQIKQQLEKTSRENKQYIEKVSILKEKLTERQSEIASLYQAFQEKVN